MATIESRKEKTFSAANNENIDTLLDDIRDALTREEETVFYTPSPGAWSKFVTTEVADDGSITITIRPTNISQEKEHTETLIPLHPDYVPVPMTDKRKKILEKWKSLPLDRVPEGPTFKDGKEYAKWYDEQEEKDGRE